MINLVICSIYHIFASSNMRYYLGNQLFVKRSQYITIETPLHKQSEKPSCASKWNVLEVATLQYSTYLSLQLQTQKHFEPIVQGCSSYIQPLVSGYKDCCWMGCWKRKRWTDYENSMCSGYYILDQGSYFHVNTLSCTILSLIKLKLPYFLI